MENTQIAEDFDLQILESKMNSHDWSRIDRNLTPLPKNPHYQVIISDPAIQKYYQRFRFVMENEDTHFSPQALALSTYLLKSSTNNYYALMLRRKYVFNELESTQNSQKFALQQFLPKRKHVFERELNFMNNLLEDNAKEYHIWTFKKDLISKIFTISQKFENQSEQNFLKSFKQTLYQKENQFIFALLIEDCRNYHAWDYRFWLVTCLGKIQEEFKWIDDLIADSKRESSVVKEIQDKLEGSELGAKELKINWGNVNSLWSHKFNLIRYLKEQKDKISQSQKEKVQADQLRQKETFVSDEVIMQMISNEFQGSVKLVSQDRENECIWNYLKGMLSFSESKYPSQTRENQQLNFIRQVIFKGKSWDQIEQGLGKFNRFQLSFLRSYSSKIVHLQKQAKFEHTLINQLKTIDSVRMKYYQYLQRNKDEK